MNDSEVTWGRVLRIWWLLVWRGYVGGFMIAVVINFIVTFGARVLGADAATADPLGFWMGVLASLPWGLVVVRMALRKQYQTFRLSFTPRAAPTTPVTTALA